VTCAVKRVVYSKGGRLALIKRSTRGGREEGNFIGKGRGLLRKVRALRWGDSTRS